jgi:DnaA-homolog protein
MRNLSTQLTLGLHLQDEATFANFYAGKNSEIVAQLKKTASGVGEKIIYLFGKRGDGSSHLLQAACHVATQYQLSSVYLPLAQFVTLTPEILHGFESQAVVCIDDLQVIAGLPKWEEALFHFFNRVHEGCGNIIMAAHDHPKLLQLALPDLVSRLSWGIVYQLHALNDQEKLAVLIKRAARRGMHLSDEVGNYLMTHCERQMGTLFSALDTLDKASLTLKRRLTIPFLKEILQI